jgi:predicted MFS family arabinose efflux permease
LLLFVVFLLAYMLSQFYRSFLAVIAPGLAAELGLTASDLANMAAAWFVVFAIVQFPLGVALDRIGPRRTVPLIMLAAVVGAALLANAHNAWLCIAANALIGLGCSPIYMGALYYLARTVPPERFGFVSACLLGFGTSGNLLAATPLSWAAERFGWRPTFLGIAAFTLAAAALFFLLVRDPPIAQRPKDKPDTSATAELARIVSLPRFWTLMPLLLLGYAAVVVERGLWVGPYFAEVHGLSGVSLGNAALAMAAAMSAGALFFGYIDKLVPAERKRLVVLGSLLTAVGFALLVLLPKPSIPVAVATFAFIGCVGLCQPLLFAHARQFFPEHLLGRGMTFANFLTIGGSGIVQWATGAYVARLQAEGAPAPEVYAALHGVMAAIVLAATAVYLLAPRPGATRAA